MKLIIFLLLIIPFSYTGAQDSLRFISGTTGAACKDIKYYDGYLYVATGSTFRVYDASTPPSYDMVFEYRYKSTIMDLVIVDKMLYVAANYDGMSKWDLNRPVKPVKLYDIPCGSSGLPMLDVSIAGDTIYLARFKKMSAYKDHGESYTAIGDFGSVTGTGRLYGADVKDGICAYTVADAFSLQNGVYLYRTGDFSLISHYVQSFCWPENVIWGKNNDILHVLGGTNTVNGLFYSLNISDSLHPQVIFCDTILGVPFGWATADPLNAVNVNDTIYVATTAGMKPGGPLDTSYVHVYDATDPADIHLINYIPAGLWHFDVAVNEPYCYIASEWYGIKTVDIGDFNHPVDLGNTPTGGWNTGSDKYGNFLVVANEGYGFKLFDLSKILEPSLAGVNNDPGFCMKAKFSDNGEYIYTINMSYESFRVYETATLQKVGAIQPSVGTGKFAVYHDRAFVEQETGGNVLNIISVTDPASPYVDSTFSMAINDMAVSGGKLFITGNDSIVVYDIDDHHFNEIASVIVESGQNAKEMAVYDDTAYVFVTQKGLVEYRLANDSTGYSLDEISTFSLPYGEPSYMAADTFGIYLSYRTNGLFACDRQTLAPEGFFRGELDTKGYVNQYGVQDLFCKDHLVFLVEYFSQTSILTHDSTFSFGIHEVMPDNGCHVLAYPNPGADRIIFRIVSSVPDEWKVTIYDLTGRLVLEKEHIRTHDVSIEWRNMKAGMYIYQVTGRNGIIEDGKIILR